MRGLRRSAADPVQRSGTGSELSWSLGEYIEPAALWKTFGLKDRRRRSGSASRRTSLRRTPGAGVYWKWFLRSSRCSRSPCTSSSVVATDAKVLLAQDFEFVPGKGTREYTSPVFEAARLRAGAAGDQDHRRRAQQLGLSRHDAGRGRRRGDAWRLGREVSILRGRGRRRVVVRGQPRGPGTPRAGARRGATTLDIELEGDPRGQPRSAAAWS